MTTALTTQGNGTALTAPTITADQMALITKTVAKDATPDELKLYLYDCARQGVHPLDKLIHFTKRGGKYTPVTSIDFMRIQAANSGECLGISDPIFGLGLSDKPQYPESATVTVKRFVQGQIAEFTATARWSEYFPGEQSGMMWKKMPHTMLGKCAEALALRKGFPKQLAGLYAREEMDQADSQAAPLVERPQSAPEPVNIHTGEVLADAAPRDPDALYIERCTAKDGKKAGEVTFSDGVVATVWASDGRLFDVAMTLCQEGQPVTAKLLAGKGNYGPTLKGLARLDGEHDQRRPEAAPPVAIDASEIPF